MERYQSLNSMVIRSLLLLIITIHLPSELNADSEGQSKVVVCSFLYSHGVPQESLYFRLGDEYHPMDFKQGARAGTISLKKMAAFEVYRESQKPAGDGVQYEFLASAPVSEGVKKALFIIVAPDEDDAGEYRVVTLDDSAESFPGAGMLFVNLTGNSIIVNFAGEKQPMEPLKTEMVSSKIAPKSSFVPLVVTNGKGERIYENRLYSQLTARKNVMIGPPKIEGGFSEVKFVNQLLPQKILEPPSQRTQ